MIHQITDIRYQITKNRLNKRFFNREISLIHIYYSTFLSFCQGPQILTQIYTNNVRSDTHICG